MYHCLAFGLGYFILDLTVVGRCACLLVIEGPLLWCSTELQPSTLRCLLGWVKRILPNLGIRITSCYKISSYTSIEVILELLVPRAALSNN